MKKDKIITANKGELTFTIEEDYPEVGVYLYVFKGETCIKDYLQSSIDTCKNIALQVYGIPINEWREINF
jgi:hypothetical protein